jgi:ABC-2 type transport system ATP-binding protein
MNGTVLTARALGKTFRRDSGEVVHALKSVSMDVAHGTLTALVGPDGAGKTTLIRLAAGLMVPDGGSLQVLGIDVAAEPQRVQDRIGYMPQKFGLYEDLSVQENLDLYADLHGVTSAIDGDDRSGTFHRTISRTLVRGHEAETWLSMHTGARPGITVAG